MPKRIAWLVVLAEDLNQASFAYRYLREKKHHPRTIRVRLPEKGRGAGEQYVRKKYPEEVREYRSRRYQSGLLVVLVDADMESVPEREHDLNTALETAGEDQREPEEAIALLIPKRHIETWILCLQGERVDEATDYRRRRDIQQKIKPAAQTFHEWSPPNYPVPAHCVDSLRRGLREARRIP